MATTIYGEQRLFRAWYFNSAPANEHADAKIFHYPYPRFSVVKKTFLNKVWDVIAGSWIAWETEYPDQDGGHYPGPGVFGVDTSDPRQETVVFGREQL